MKEKAEKEYYKLIKICYIRNIISLICFTILAIIFQKWYIVFGALIFWCSVEKEQEDEQYRYIRRIKRMV